MNRNSMIGQSLSDTEKRRLYEDKQRRKLRNSAASSILVLLVAFIVISKLFSVAQEREASETTRQHLYDSSMETLRLNVEKMKKLEASESP